jgi:hypothetical protein
MRTPTHKWHEGTPTNDRVVEVWYSNTCILATWDGSTWRTLEGTPIHGVAWWREK